ncbi:hypothetical protein C9I56_24585 [Paraburkholderia caribensis]|uniref:Uncharacterized protein n=1 Tax=Paraburkholderia caribensis TaxID=75105 RepID=A0A9Q6RZP0_9BURK|nr:hypothetical protein C9I56_24585 [Paraburkholderia caribensis]QLB61853.1 hypothetical protein A9O66_05330 [Paraburkholderia caribensis]
MREGFREGSGSTAVVQLPAASAIEANRSASERNGSGHNREPNRSYEAASNNTRRAPCCAPPALAIIF